MNAQNMPVLIVLRDYKHFQLLQGVRIRSENLQYLHRGRW